MRRWSLPVSVAIAALIGPLPLVTFAAPAPTASAPRAPASAAGSVGANPRPLSSVEEQMPMPSGHPQVMPDDDDEPGDLPPGHPPAGHPPTTNPGRPGKTGLPPSNDSHADPSLPPGTIVVEVRNGADGALMPGVDVTMGSVKQSIAKGDDHARRVVTSDANGEARFTGLESGSNIAYRLSIIRDGATYAAPPYQISNGAMRTTIYVFPVSHETKGVQFATQGIAYVELRDDTIVIEQAYRVFNLGSITWLPTDQVVSLPAGYKAFSAQKAMSDVGFDAVENGARFRGTIAPGQHDISYRFQVPYDGKDEMEIELGLLPNVQMFRVMAEAPRGTTLEVPGFPPPELTSNNNGQRVLVTERETNRPDPTFQRVRIRLHNLPTRSNGRWVALSLAAASMLGGFVYAYGPKSRKPTKKGKKGQKNADNDLTQSTPLDPVSVEKAKKKLLDDLRDLETARDRGEIGPKFYESERRSLIDALAHLIAQVDASASSQPVENPGDKLPKGS